MKKINYILTNLLARQSFKNTFWNLFSTVVYPIFLLGTTPVFIQYLGIEQFGLWMLVNSISQAMSVINMGLGDANIKYISDYRASNNQEGIKNVVSTTFGLSLLVIGVVIFFGLIFSYLVGEYQWFKISEANRGIMTTCIRLALILFSLKFLEIVLLAVFQGFERYDTQSKLSLLSKAFIMVANLVWVLLGYDLVVVLLSSIVTQFLFLIFEMVLIKKQYAYLSFVPNYRLDDIKRIFSFSLWSWFQSVLAIVVVNVDKFIVAWFSGVQTLSYYSLGYIVMTQVHAVFSASISWVFPVVSRKQASGESLKDYFKDMQGLIVTAGFVSIIAFLFVDKFLISLWLDAGTTENAYVFIRLFIYSNLFYLVNIIPHNFLNGSGYVKYNTYAELVTKSLTIIGMIAGYSLMGDQGLIWGIVFSIGLLSPLKTAILDHYAFKERNRFLWIEPVVCGGLVIAFFELQDPLSKVFVTVCFIFVFYYSYIQPSRRIGEFIQRVVKRNPKNGK